MVTFPYNTTDFAFTLEEVFLLFSTETDDTYFDLTIAIDYFEFFSEVEKTKVLEYKIPLFNNQQKYFVGDKIHRNLAALPSYVAGSGFQYKTAKVSFLATEISIVDGSTVSTATLNDVKFVAGPKPTVFVENVALLSTNPFFERVSKTGIFNVAMLLPSGTHDLEIYKNSTLISTSTITATATDNIYLKQLKMIDFTPTIGDIITIKIKDVLELKKIVIVKDILQHNQIVFIDAFKLPRTIEFLGEFSTPVDFKQTTHKYKRNLVEILEIVETEKVNTFKVDTGYGLKKDAIIIEELLDSKRAFLIDNDLAKLEIVPIAKNLIKEDSAEQSFQYQVDFQINKRNA